MPVIRMTSQRTSTSRRIPEMLETIRQNSEYQTENFVLDFLNIWFEIHNSAVDATLEAASDICQSLLESHILPFFQKYRSNGNLQQD